MDVSLKYFEKNSAQAGNDNWSEDRILTSADKTFHAIVCHFLNQETVNGWLRRNFFESFFHVGDCLNKFFMILNIQPHTAHIGFMRCIAGKKLYGNGEIKFYFAASFADLTVTPATHWIPAASAILQGFIRQRNTFFEHCRVF